MNQYDNPIQCYSDEVLQEMSEKGTWKLEATGPANASAGAAPPAAAAASPLAADGAKFTPQNSAVLAVLNDHDGGKSYPR